jgi:hypothetical protein
MPPKYLDKNTTGYCAGWKKVSLGELDEIEAQLNAIASNLPYSTDLDDHVERRSKILQSLPAGALA